MITLTAPQGKAFFRDNFYYGKIVHIAFAEEEETFELVDEIIDNETDL